MRSRCHAGLLLLLCLSTAPAWAEDAPEAPPREQRKHLLLGLRLGYAFPAGDLVRDQKLSSRYVGMITPQFDVGYSLTPNWSVEGAFQFGIARVAPGACDPSVRCSGAMLRFSTDVNYHFLSQGPLQPWMGAGLNFELASLSTGREGSSQGRQASGFLFAHVQGGIDVEVASFLRVGPYFTGTLGKYTTVFETFDPFGGSQTVPSSRRAFHAWLQPGLRLQFLR
ncbi:hypothetical protein [Citreicoccus inhibens]|uniref:hypothetical protein n=1 Tax=Citreicoccus inhibens TaxID=2849499 RepID=UPI0018F606D0|nr:hypothetical protein [Citreicoccus inhibens]